MDKQRTVDDDREGELKIDHQDCEELGPRSYDTL